MIVKYQAYSDVGCMRANNEDMILVSGRFLRDEGAQGRAVISPPARWAAIVADGMGGNDGGELASDIATQEFDSWLASMPEGLTDAEVSHWADDFAKTTHALINRRGAELDGFHGMGTTLTGVFAYDGRWFWINIGDSRVYILRDGIFRQVTRDHSLRNLYNDPTQPSNIIYNCLGAGDDFVSFADCDAMPIFDNDSLLICSDGLSDMIDDEQITSLMQVDAQADEFITAAKQAGGADNVSVIRLKFNETEAPALALKLDEPKAKDAPCINALAKISR